MNLIFLFIVFSWFISFNKFIILNISFIVHNIVILTSVYATLMGASFCVNLLMSSTLAAMNSFNDCDIFDKAIPLSAIVHDNNNNESFSIKNCRSRYEKFVYLSCHARAHAVRQCS